jgi:SAM-dependent methyltransferase
VATAFDDLAFGYDASFTHTALGTRLRELVWTRCDALFAPGHRVLELGCGTGEDAVHLARRGAYVVATDPAERMLQMARPKAARVPRDRIDFHCLPMEAAPHTFDGYEFDGVFSNFGAVNCVGDLRMLAHGLAAICKPNAALLWVVKGRCVPWEWMWYSARGRFGKVFRRFNPHGVHWRGLHIRYWSPDELRRALAPHFAVTRIAPLGCALPPSYASAWLERSPRTLGVLSILERAAQRAPFLAACGDHFMIEARRAPR